MLKISLIALCKSFSDSILLYCKQMINSNQTMHEMSSSIHKFKQQILEDLELEVIDGQLKPMQTSIQKSPTKATQNKRKRSNISKQLPSPSSSADDFLSKQHENAGFPVEVVGQISLHNDPSGKSKAEAMSFSEMHGIKSKRSSSSVKQEKSRSHFASPFPSSQVKLHSGISDPSTEYLSFGHRKPHTKSMSSLEDPREMIPSSDFTISYVTDEEDSVTQNASSADFDVPFTSLAGDVNKMPYNTSPSKDVLLTFNNVETQEVLDDSTVVSLRLLKTPSRTKSPPIEIVSSEHLFDDQKTGEGAYLNQYAVLPPVGTSSHDSSAGMAKQISVCRLENHSDFSATLEINPLGVTNVNTRQHIVFSQMKDRAKDLVHPPDELVTKSNRISQASLKDSSSAKVTAEDIIDEDAPNALKFRKVSQRWRNKYVSDSHSPDSRDKNATEDDNSPDPGSEINFHGIAKIAAKAVPSVNLVRRSTHFSSELGKYFDKKPEVAVHPDHSPRNTAESYFERTKHNYALRKRPIQKQNLTSSKSADHKSTTNTVYHDLPTLRLPELIRVKPGRNKSESLIVNNFKDSPPAVIDQNNQLGNLLVAGAGLTRPSSAPLKNPVRPNKVWLAQLWSLPFFIVI